MGLSTSFTNITAAGTNAATATAITSTLVNVTSNASTAGVILPQAIPALQGPSFSGTGTGHSDMSNSMGSAPLVIVIWNVGQIPFNVYSQSGETAPAISIIPAGIAVSYTVVSPKSWKCQIDGKYGNTFAP